jgi:hypothetical protein
VERNPAARSLPGFLLGDQWYVRGSWSTGRRHVVCGIDTDIGNSADTCIGEQPTGMETSSRVMCASVAC